MDQPNRNYDQSPNVYKQQQPAPPAPQQRYAQYRQDHSPQKYWVIIIELITVLTVDKKRVKCGKFKVISFSFTRIIVFHRKKCVS